MVALPIMSVDLGGLKVVIFEAIEVNKLEKIKIFFTGFIIWTTTGFRGRQLWLQLSPVFSHQFWEVRTVLKSSDPDFFRTLLGKGKKPKNGEVIAIFPKG